MQNEDKKLETNGAASGLVYNLVRCFKCILLDILKISFFTLIGLLPLLIFMDYAMDIRIDESYSKSIYFGFGACMMFFGVIYEEYIHDI